MSANGKIWVFAETDEGAGGTRVADVALELLGRAVEMAASLPEPPAVEAVLLGENVTALAEELAACGAETVHVADDPRLKLWSPLTYVPVVTALAEKHRPDVFLFGATVRGGVLGPSVAVRLRTGMAAHAIDLRFDGERRLVACVPAFGGRVVGEILCPDSRPQMASVKPGVFLRKEGAKAAPCRAVKADLSCLDGLDAVGLTPLGVRRDEPSGVPLQKAKVVLCGGFGIGDEESWRLIEEISTALSGAAACTRPVVDRGWTGEHVMVGTSGCSIRPGVYLGFGISGATHHICGMSDSGFVVSVNKDPDAPVFEVSDVRVVADAGEVLKALGRILMSDKTKGDAVIPQDRAAR